MIYMPGKLSLHLSLFQGCVMNLSKQEAVLSAEMKAKEELRIAMEKKERQLQSEMEGLELQVQFLSSLFS